jgi:hypothetical protein
MTDLMVAQYRFRLARRGWARGEAGQRVAAAARQRLPSLVVARLAEVWPAADGEVSEPVRLRFRVGLRELAAACESDETLAALVARLLPSERETLAGLAGGALRGTVERLSPPAEPASPLAGAAVSAVADVARVLREWRARGDLAARLESFAEGALEDWHRALLDGGGAAGRRGPPLPPADLEAVVRAFVEPPATARAALLRRRILAIVEVLARLEQAPGAPEVMRALDAMLPLPLAEPQSSPAASHRDLSASLAMPTGAPAPSPPPARAPREGPRGWPPRSIGSALPFLLLRPLERLGYLDALEAAFTAARRADELSVFATALAYKVLAPPERGWRRDPRALEAAAAFAGRLEPVSEAALLGLADGAASLLSPLDGLVARAVLGGHDPARPLLLVAASSGRLLLEVDGLFPIAWTEGLFTALAGCTAPIVIPAGAAETALLAEVHARGLRFVTDAPPTRGERWRRLRHRQPLWSNDSQADDATLARAAAGALDVEADAVRLVETLAARRGSTIDRAGALDRSLALAAAAGLGDLAWTFWHEREPTSPELALQRLSDLSAQVSLREGALEVLLPLGPRRRDLERHHFLGELRVPWLPGRLVTLAGG